MSTLEKILTGLLALFVIVLVYFSFHEITEPHGGSFGGERSEFERSFGSIVRIGPFVNVVGERSSGGQEQNCEELQPVIVAALHDIKIDLQDLRLIEEGPDSFEVDQATLDLFCNKEASLTIADGRGAQLILDKQPFVRVIPSAPEDAGYEVKIDARFVPLGGSASANPTASADVLIPDRYLQTATSTSQ
jgi:hypothetical protein